MAEPRRYGEREVREIFGSAARPGAAEPRSLTEANGLTLADIQDIGREVGLDPAAVARAAAAIDARATRSLRRESLGMPIGVSRIVALPREPTDREWEQLVAELRSTFGARGRVSAVGRLREWSNGNLHACIEPVAEGYQLRLATRKGDAAMLNALGAAGLATGAIALGAALLAAGPQDVLIPAMIGASGAGAFLANLLRLPRWARRREQQMDYLAARMAVIMKEPASGDRLPPGASSGDEDGPGAG